MVQLETYRSNAAEVPTMRRWLFAGLILSLALHVGLFIFLRGQRLEGFNMADERLAPPRAFHMKRVSIPETPEATEQRLTLPTSSPNVAPIQVPAERPEVSEITVAPQIPEVPQQVFTEKPRVEMTGLEKLAKPDVTARAEMDKELNSLAQTLIKESPRSPRQPMIPVGSGKGAGGGTGTANVSIPGMATVDDMIARSGSLHAGDKAGMPGGALFEYDSFDLRPEAMLQLRKLGTLIQKNPQATFSIEGHTDSFGSAEYNQTLSENRAMSVKMWLVQIFGIPPERIQTRGYGNTRPIIPADRSQEEQAPNRRVELVVKTNRR